MLKNASKRLQQLMWYGRWQHKYLFYATQSIYIFIWQKYKHALYWTETRCICGCVHSFQFQLYQTKYLMTLFHWRFCDFSFAGLSFLSQFYFYQFLSLCIQTHYNYIISIENKNWKLVHQWLAGSGYNQSDWIKRLWIVSNWLLVSIK